MTTSEGFIVLFLELILGFQILYFFNSVLGKPAHKRKKWMCFVVFGVLGYLYLSVPDSFVVSSLLVTSAIFSLSLVFNAELKTKIIFTVLYAVLMSIVNMISVYCFYMLNLVDTASLTVTDEENTFLLFQANLLSFMIMLAVIQIIRLIATRRSFPLPYRYYILLILIPLISIYQLNVLTFYTEMNIHYFISAIGFLWINVMIIYILDTMIDKFQFKLENARLEQQMNEQEASYDQTVRSFQSVNRIIHDTNQQYLYIEECLKREDPAAALEHIRTTLHKVENA
ncbi:hypothetical protein KDC22_08070 [Paenibacillus tritici]|uniref:hypothetical protein n=1 Tax=Paenibacillus tritici TaxID=1873425 RepID=UPI001BA80F69|nr:hypothetical protein [Paenibacillus tritici]QUL56445.1 hypothetical protein KDC22_08070 [Paenibacillus tritici]